MLNHIVMMGRLTKDPELRQAGDTPVCSFRIACDRDYKNKAGEKETDFVDVVVWRKMGENVAKYFSKGRMAVVSGRLQIRPWTDQEGNKRYSTEIVAEHVYFGDSKPKAQEGDAGRPPEGFVPDFGNEGGQPPVPPEGFVPDFGDEELYDGQVTVHVGQGPERAMLCAAWDDDAQICRIIHELNFGQHRTEPAA